MRQNETNLGIQWYHEIIKLHTFFIYPSNWYVLDMDTLVSF